MIDIRSTDHDHILTTKVQIKLDRSTGTEAKRHRCKGVNIYTRNKDKNKTWTNIIQKQYKMHKSHMSYIPWGYTKHENFMHMIRWVTLFQFFLFRLLFQCVYEFIKIFTKCICPFKSVVFA